MKNKIEQDFGRKQGDYSNSHNLDVVQMGEEEDDLLYMMDSLK